MDTFFYDKRRWSHAEVAELLVSNNALTSVTLDDALEFVKRMLPSSVKAGTVLFSEGEENSQFMMFILQGEAIVEANASSHSDSTVFKMLGQGDLIGELGILDNRARSATVTAVSEMSLAIMDQASLSTMIRELPAVACKFLGTILQSVSARLRESNHRVHTLNQVNKSLNRELAGFRSQLATMSGARPVTGFTGTQGCTLSAYTDPKLPQEIHSFASPQPLGKGIKKPQIPRFSDTHSNGSAPDMRVAIPSATDREAPSTGAIQPPFSITYPLKS